MRNVLALLVLSSGVAFAGPGFDGVGDRGEMPRLERRVAIEAFQFDEQEEKLLEMVKESNPEAYQRLLRLKERDEQAYVRQLFQIALRGQRMKIKPETSERFIVIQSLEVELLAMAARLAGETEAEQPKTRAAMTEVAGKLLDAKQADRRARVEDLNKKIAKIQEEIKVRDEERDARIEEYIDQLTRRKASGL